MPQDPGGWYDARNAVTALRDALVAAGLAQHFPYLRADLNAFGQGIVEVGRTTPEGASRMAELISLGLAVTPAHDLRIEVDRSANDRGTA